MKQRKRRNRRAKNRRLEPIATPTHFVRLTRPVTVIDPGKRWFVVRIAGRRDVRAEVRLREAGFEPYLPVDAVERPARGRLRLVRKRPLAGYVFVGLGSAEPEEWQRVLAQEDVAEFVGEPERPVEIAARQLQRFAGELAAPAVAELCDRGGTVLARFPARMAGILEGEAGAFAPVNTPLAIHMAA